MECRFTIITEPRFVMVLSEFGLRAKHQVIIWLSWSCPETSGQDYFFSSILPHIPLFRIPIRLQRHSTATR